MFKRFLKNFIISGTLLLVFATWIVILIYFINFLSFLELPSFLIAILAFLFVAGASAFFTTFVDNPTALKIRQIVDEKLKFLEDTPKNA